MPLDEKERLETRGRQIDMERSRTAILLASSWQAFLGGVNLLAALVFGLARLGDIPFESRLWIVGGAIFWLWVTVLATFHLASRRPSDRTFKFAVGFVALGAISASSYLLLDLVTTYQSIRVESVQLSPTVQRLTIESPRFLVNFNVTFVPPPDATVEIAATSKGPDHIPALASAPLGDGLTTTVTAFHYPQILQIDGTLKVPGKLRYYVRPFKLINGAAPDSEMVFTDESVLTTEQLWYLRLDFCLFAITLWIIGCVFGLFSYFF
jgi:hypothetical protein